MGVISIFAENPIFMKYLNLFQIALAAFAFFFSGCASQESAQESMSGNAIIRSYINLKNALYEDDRAKAEIMAKNMKRALEKFSAADSAGWQSASSAISASLDSIAITTDIKKQRMHFEKLSDEIYSNMQSLGLKGEKLYRQFCPMAFDNRGAYWISDKEEIENPYFGAEMANCGEVRDTLDFE